MRNVIAISVCALSALIGAICLSAKTVSVTTVAFSIAGVWSLMGSLVARAETRQYWRRYNIDLKEVWTQAKSGKLRLDLPIARLIDLGAAVLALSGVASLFIS